MQLSLTQSRSKAAMLLAGVAAVWFVPYAFAVKPTMALSYVVGYNNRVALILFVAVAASFAWLTRGVLSRSVDAADRKSSGVDLALALVFVLACCFARHHHAQPPRGEASYAIDRLQMLVSGVAPYTGFEYVYGPLNLYAPLWIARTLRLSIVNGFYAWWYLQWLLGTALLWWTVKMLPGCLRRRRWIFAGLLLLEIPSILAEGTAYTPLRMAGMAFCVVAVVSVGRRSGNAMGSSLSRALALWAACSAAVLVELGISPEQGLALGVGLLGWLALRAWRAERVDAAADWGVAGGLMLSLGLAALWFAHMGVFKGLAEFAGGAYSFPLVPSVAVALLLLAYVAAACAGVRAWLAGDLAGPSVAMALCGFAGLPAAFGRCDLGHLELGSAAFFLGVATIESSPSLRRFWSPLAVVCVLGFAYFGVGKLVVDKAQHRGAASFVDPRNLAAAPEGGGLVLQAPCPVVYRVVTIWPGYDRTPGAQCLDPGFYAGTLDVLTTATMARKIAELENGPREPLLMRAGPLRGQFASDATEVETKPLRILEQALFLPPLRNAPLTYEPLIRAIEENYTAGLVVAGGYQVWEPKGRSGY